MKIQIYECSCKVRGFGNAGPALPLGDGPWSRADAVTLRGRKGNPGHNHFLLACI